jgi:cytidylate kinase
VEPSTIAIDGPAASGKSTVAKILADELGYLYFDTGVMYRAITWEALAQDIDIRDERAVTGLAESVPIEVSAPSLDDDRDSDIRIGGKDITWDIREPEVDANVSLVSAYPGVRAALTKQQRRIGQRGRVVMVGRDIGSVVLPDADIKFYLDASVEKRARRRYLESSNRGGRESYQEVLETMEKRDRIDSTRDVAPLCAAEDAVVINTDDLDIDQVLVVIKTHLAAWKRVN